jgi:hypothetical protein
LLLAVPVLPAVPVLLALPARLAVPVLEGAFEPQPTLIRLIRATSAGVTNGRSFLLMFAPICVWGCGDSGSLRTLASH